MTSSGQHQGRNRTDRDVLDDVLRMSTKAANDAHRAADAAATAVAKVELLRRDYDKFEENFGALAGEVGSIAKKIGRWPDGPDDGGSGVLGALAKRSPSMVDEEEYERAERNRTASPTQSIQKPTIPPAVRNAFKRHPVLSGIGSAIVTGVSIAWAIFEVLAIVGK